MYNIENTRWKAWFDYNKNIPTPGTYPTVEKTVVYIECMTYIEY